jgi:hypothetical protein
LVAADAPTSNRSKIGSSKERCDGARTEGHGSLGHGGASQGDYGCSSQVPLIKVWIPPHVSQLVSGGRAHPQPPAGRTILHRQATTRWSSKFQATDLLPQKRIGLADPPGITTTQTCGISGFMVRHGKHDREFHGELRDERHGALAPICVAECGHTLAEKEASAATPNSATYYFRGCHGFSLLMRGSVRHMPCIESIP